MGLLGIIWGASFLSIKVGLEEIPFVTLVMHRVAWACAILWAYVVIRRLPVPADPRIWGAFLVMGLLNNVIPFSLMAWGQQFIETGLTSIFNAGTAIFGVLVAALVFADERLTLRKGVGVLVAFAGVAVAIGLDSLRQFDIRSLAQLAVIGGTISYAFASAWARKTLKGLTPPVAAAGMLTGAMLILLPAALYVDGMPQWPALPATYAAVAYFAVFGTALAYLLYYRVLAMAGAGNAMLVTLLIPPVAIVLGAVVLGERLAPQAFAGFGLLAIGLLILDGRILRLMRG
ncbi:DMT family transporter [Rhodobacteraceae bacterium N5(2021)]|uniref:DMT family transporter n=2 Tax=Gymnodinialimonas phycosphaerae TaxID=2841589 RepID=A0A975YI10_9RHOB|nr:DMT family transporter [Gymnodinialimonas phycosphaerae]